MNKKYKIFVETSLGGMEYNGRRVLMQPTQHFEVPYQFDSYDEAEQFIFDSQSKPGKQLYNCTIVTIYTTH